MEGSTEAPSQDELIKQFEGTATGRVLEWLFDEERKYLIVPIASSGPDTGILVGLTWYHTDIWNKDKRDMILAAITTQNGQNSFMFSWTEPGLPGKKGRVNLSLSMNENPQGGIRYFGEGNRNNYEDVASNYRATSRGFGLGYIYEFTGHWTMFTGYNFSSSTFDDPDKDFEFGDEDDEASRPISQVHPDVFESEEFQDGYKSGRINLSLSYDSRSRERLLRLGPGWRASIGGSWADQSFGGDDDWADVSAGFAHYIALTESGRHIIAYRGQYIHSWGFPPFNQLPALSSGTNRGYYSGRFRGDNKLEGNLEYRWYATRFFGLAVFADSGKTFKNGEDVNDALFTDYHPAYGAGLRIKIPPEIIIRIDFGTSHEQSNFYFTLGESF